MNILKVKRKMLKSGEGNKIGELKTGRRMLKLCQKILKRNFTGKRIRTDWGILIEKTNNK